MGGGGGEHTFPCSPQRKVEWNWGEGRIDYAAHVGLGSSVLRVTALPYCGQCSSRQVYTVPAIQAGITLIFD
jgi:hypothetical protein